MKEMVRRIMVLAFCLLFGIISTVAIAADVTSYVIGAAPGNKVVKAKTIDEDISVIIDGNEVVFETPVPNIDGDYQIYLSYAWTDGEKWILVPQEDYLVQSILINRDNLNFKIVRFILPGQGNGRFWLRVWGQDQKSGEWLLINQKSEYVRNDTQGNPGYEFLINLDGQCQKVPDDHQTRR